MNMLLNDNQETPTMQGSPEKQAFVNNNLQNSYFINQSQLNNLQHRNSNGGQNASNQKQYETSKFERAYDSNDSWQPQ